MLYEMTPGDKVLYLQRSHRNARNHTAFMTFLPFFQGLDWVFITCEQQNKWCTSFEGLAEPIREGKRLYSPDYGWMYV